MQFLGVAMTDARVRHSLLQPQNIKPLVANIGVYADAGAIN